MTSQRPIDLSSHPTLPRIAITFCTQCKWMLRAAYFAQELLSTFSTTIGEVALIPATGGIFTVTLTYVPESLSSELLPSSPPNNGEEEGGDGGGGGVKTETILLWDRKAEGGFPETKILKQRVRNYLDPRKDLGHSDTPSKQASKQIQPESMPKAESLSKPEQPPETSRPKLGPDRTVCEDCT